MPLTPIRQQNPTYRLNPIDSNPGYTLFMRRAAEGAAACRSGKRSARYIATKHALTYIHFGERRITHIPIVFEVFSKYDSLESVSEGP